jgi:hypothetical protein
MNPPRENCTCSPGARCNSTIELLLHGSRGKYMNRSITLSKKTFELAEKAGAILITQVKDNQRELLKRIIKENY